MPYINQALREAYDGVDETIPGSPGELNYLITMLCNNYVKDTGLSYQSINDVLGALEGAKLEFYRRVAAPYEDVKIKHNGDVY